MNLQTSVPFQGLYRETPESVRLRAQQNIEQECLSQSSLSQSHKE